LTLTAAAHRREVATELQGDIMDRKGSAIWEGSIREGRGTVSTESGTLATAPYSFTSRFEHGQGTNPEELLAAAHAGCFSMAFSGQLAAEKLTADRIETSATVTVEKLDSGFAITRVHLSMSAKIPGATQEQFERLSGNAKAGCPVSKLFNATITLDATLVP
jgi:osmotically inducible protein OsmC